MNTDERVRGAPRAAGAQGALQECSTGSHRAASGGLVLASAWASYSESSNQLPTRGLDPDRQKPTGSKLLLATDRNVDRLGPYAESCSQRRASLDEGRAHRMIRSTACFLW